MRGTLGIRARVALISALVLVTFGLFTAQAQSFKALSDTPYLLVQEIEPNPEGSFEQVYAFYGALGETGGKPARIVATPGNLPPREAFAEGGDQVLRIFHFNDMHNHLTDFSGSRGDTHRLAQMVKIVRDAKRAADSNEAVLFISAGDDMTGTIFDELLGSSPDNFRRNAAYEAYSAAGMDVSVLGNHEFDRGAEILELSIERSARFPVLSANIYGSRFLDAEDHPAAIVGVVNGVRVGIVGLTTVRETKLGTQVDPNLAGASLLDTLQTVLPAVEPFADFVIVLTHVGYNGEIGGVIRHPLDEGDVDIAEMTASILGDKPAMVLGGHTHTLLNADGLDTFHAGVPVVQAGDWGKYLGEMTVSLQQQGESVSAAFDYAVRTIKRRDDRDPGNPIYEQDDDYDQTFEESVMGPMIAQLDEVRAEIIGQAGPSEEITTASTILDRYQGESAIANFMNDTIVQRSSGFPPGPNGENQEVDIAIFNATAIISGVNQNAPITFGDWFNVMPFADVIVVSEFTGQELRDLIVDNAKRIVRDEELQASGGPINPGGFVSRGFLHFSSAVRYEIVIGDDAPHSTTAQNITVKGQPIEEQLDTVFRIAFGDYILPRGNEGWNGGQIGGGMPDGFTGLDLRGKPANETGLIYRNEIVEFLRGSTDILENLGAAKDGRVVVLP